MVLKSVIDPALTFEVAFSQLAAARLLALEDGG